MNAELLLAHYECIADAPDAIGRLRRFILDLAVRGKLVEQDPNDEPASDLLKRVAAEKARLVKAGEIPREKLLPQLADTDTTFALPQGWEWVRLGHLTKLVTSGSRDWAKHYSNAGAIFVRMGNLSKDHYRLRLDHIQHVQPPADGEGTRTRLEASDILISITGDVGMLGLIPEGFGEAYINQHTAMVRPMAEMKSRYLPELFRSPFAQAQFNEPQRGIKNSFRLTDITQFVVPLPPLAEQHRIVAKVDELMALCDQLEAVRTVRETSRDQLTLSTLSKLNEPDPQSFADDARFALEHLEPLTKRTAQIQQLRQTIRNLAVRGQLVEQDPNDEPAAALFQRVQTEKARMVKAGIIPRPKESARDLDFLADALPTSWLPIALGDVCSLVTSGSRGWGEYYAETGPGFVRAQNIRFGKLRLDGLACVNPPAKSEGARTQVAKGDLLIVITGAGVTNPALLYVDLGEAYVSQHVGLVRPCDTELSPWLLLCLMADAGGRAELTMRAYGAGKPGLNLDNIRSLSVPLPPLAEQHRIVAKVDELMALCDQLEASLVEGEQTRSKLLEAVLGEALEPA